MKLLFVDDEKRRMDSYFQELKFKHDVIFKRDVDEALKHLEKHGKELEGVILDIMMPPGEAFENEPRADYGYRSGILFFERIRSDYPHLPVIIFTNVTDPAVAEYFERDNFAVYCRKSDYLSPTLFREWVEDAIRFLNNQEK